MTLRRLGGKTIKESGQKVEILFLTTECSASMKEEAKKMGVCAWIPKPTRADLLLNILKRVVDKICYKDEALAYIINGGRI